MFGPLNRTLLAVVVVGAFFVTPSTALACSGGPSAVNVYTPCLAGGGGSKPTSSTNKGSSGGASRPLPVSRQTADALSKAGKDKGILHNLVTNPGLGARRLASAGPTASKAPSAIGSALDLGFGPTALLAVLAGTAAILLVASGVRGYRNWRS